MGRFEHIVMPHWSYPEMREAFGRGGVRRVPQTVQGRESPHRRRRRPQDRGILADETRDVILEQVFYIIFANFPKTRPEKCIFAAKSRPEKC